MLGNVMTGVLLLCLGITNAFAAEAFKKIRIASKAAGESLVPYVIPQRLGFYREEGMDVDVIVTRGTVTTQVVVSGAVDYSNGGSIPAILGGARLKILQVSTDKPSQYLVVSPKITSMKQLNGKTVAISDASGNSTLLFRELLEQERRCRGNRAIAGSGRAVGAVGGVVGRGRGRDDDYHRHGPATLKRRDFAFWPTAATMCQR